MANTLKKLLSLMIAAVMIFTMIPAAYATEETMEEPAATEATEATEITEKTEPEVEEDVKPIPSKAYTADRWIEVSTEAELLGYLAGNATQSELSINVAENKDTTIGIRLMSDVEVDEKFESSIKRYASYFVGYYNSADTSANFSVNVVLDLNGYTLTDATSVNRMFGVYSSDLVITNGKIVANGDYKSTGGVIFTSGACNIVIDGVNLTAKSYTKTSHGNICNIGSASASLTITNSCIELIDEDKTAGRGGLVYISAAAPVTLTNSTFIGGNASEYGGQFVVNAGSVFTATDCVFQGGESATTGGQFYVGSSSAQITFNDCTFKDGYSTTSGGLFHVAAAAAVLDYENCKFIGGESVTTGGQINIDAAVTANFDECSFEGGYAAGNGGKFYINHASCTVNLTDCAFIGGESAKMGGSVYHRRGILNVENTTFNGGKSGTVGGNICVYYRGVANFTGCSIADGKSVKGGNLALYNADSTLLTQMVTVTMDDTVISNGTAVELGGNIYQYNPDGKAPTCLAMNNCTVTGGNATQDAKNVGMGGNIYIAGFDLTDEDGVVYHNTAILNNSKVINGQAQRNGGNICGAGYARVYVNKGTIVSDGCSVSANNGGGGNIYLGNKACQLYITDATVKNGTANTYGGNIRVGAGLVVADNVTVSGGMATNGLSIYINDNTDAKFFMRSGSISHTEAEDVLVKIGAGTLTLAQATVCGFDPTAALGECGTIASYGNGTYTVVHKNVDGMTKTGTCEETGTVTIPCAICEGTYTYDVEVGHRIVIDKAVDPTCETIGLTEGLHCAICDYVVAQEVLPAAHAIVIDAGVAATCEGVGLTEGQHCENCDYVVAQEEIPALGHTYVENICANCGCKEIDIAITQVSLRPSSAGLYFNGNFSYDRNVNVVTVGIAVSIENELPVADGSDPSSMWSDSATSVIINNILSEDNALVDNALNATTVIYARPYVQMEDGTFFYGDVVAVNLLQVLQSIDAQIDVLNTVQKEAITAMYTKYKTLMDMWNLPKLKED